MSDEFLSFSQLAAATVEGRDWVIESRASGSATAIVAPHGGSIEPHTDEIAKTIAGPELSFYCFRGLSKTVNLHITSHRFDEPRCLNLVGQHAYVLTVHGWGEPGIRGCVGGLDHALCVELIEAFADAGLNIFAGTGGLAGLNRLNIANRGMRRAGVQLELTMEFRKNRRLVADLAAITRKILLLRE